MNMREAEIRGPLSAGFITRLMTFALVGFILMNAASISRVVQSYAHLYGEMGQEQTFLAGLFIAIPNWGYWLIALAFSVFLVWKDSIVKDPLTRFMANAVAYLWVGLVLAAITFAITGPVTNLVNTIK